MLSDSAAVDNSAPFFTTRICPLVVSPTKSRPSGAKVIVAATEVLRFATTLSEKFVGSVANSHRLSSTSSAFRIIGVPFEAPMLCSPVALLQDYYLKGYVVVRCDAGCAM